jgi:hypothetical protein
MGKTEPIKSPLVLTAALVAGVRWDRLSLADPQNTVLRASKSADRDKVFPGEPVFEALVCALDRLQNSWCSIHSNYSLSLLAR